MRKRAFWFMMSAWITSLLGVTAHAVTVQDGEDNILPDGSAFLWVEAESFVEGADDPTTGFIHVDKFNPIQTATMTGDPPVEVVKGGLDVLPADTNASGGAGVFMTLENVGATATWQVQFAIPATYYLYLHWSVYNRDANTNYGNEDSFYVPPAFNLNSRSDWIGFEGVDQFGDPKTGDSDRDGYIDGFPVIAQNYVSEGVVEAHNSTDEDFYDGQFHWYWIYKADDMDENNAFVSFDGHGIRYDVTEEDLGTVLDFQITSREPYGAIDGLLFSTSPELLYEYSQEQLDEFFLNLGGAPLLGDFDASGVLDLPDVNMLNAEIAAGTNNEQFDVNEDNQVNSADLIVWVRDLRKTWFGDANLDGEFSSDDLVAVFATGKYELNEDATWDQGDWTGDLRFESGDLVAAFSDGGYEMGAKPAVRAVPEPSTIGLLILGFAGIAWRRRSANRSI